MAKSRDELEAALARAEAEHAVDLAELIVTVAARSAQQAEITRLEAELARNDAELARLEAENTRLLAEVLGISTDTARKLAEALDASAGELLDLLLDAPRKLLGPAPGEAGR